MLRSTSNSSTRGSMLLEPFALFGMPKILTSGSNRESRDQITHAAGDMER
jgi:hypothetical protein